VSISIIDENNEHKLDIDGINNEMDDLISKVKIIFEEKFEEM